MLFEQVDYYADSFLEMINKLMPKEMSDKELEFILYKKMRSYLLKRRIKNKVDEILKTDPELLEIEDILKRINK